jgi:hypothetical protein
MAPTENTINAAHSGIPHMVGLSSVEAKRPAQESVGMDKSIFIAYSPFGIPTLSYLKPLRNTFLCIYLLTGYTPVLFWHHQ